MHTRTRAGASSGSGSPLWDLGHFRMKCLPCSSTLSDLTSGCRAKRKNILGGSHLETPMCPVGSSSGNPCRNGANPLLHTRAGAGQSCLRKPCWNSLLCGNSSVPRRKANSENSGSETHCFPISYSLSLVTTLGKLIEDILYIRKLRLQFTGPKYYGQKTGELKFGFAFSQPKPTPITVDSWIINNNKKT